MRLGLLSLSLGSLFAVSHAFQISRPAFACSLAVAMSSTSAETTETCAAEVKVGDAIPAVEMKELQTGDDAPNSIILADLIAGKKVAIFGVPGAFTPGCSKSHLPSFMTAQDDLKAKGVEMTICVSTNDPYTMEAWGRTSGGADAGIRFISDATGGLTRSLGLVVQGPVGIKTRRFSLIAENGVVTHYFSSAKQASDTWAPAVLAEL